MSGNSRHAAARAASNTTLGYSKGRAVSSASRRLEDIHKKPQDVAPGLQLPFLGLSLEDNREDGIVGEVDAHEEDALDEFQLDAPES